MPKAVESNETKELREHTSLKVSKQYDPFQQSPDDNQKDARRQQHENCGNGHNDNEGLRVGFCTNNYSPKQKPVNKDIAKDEDADNCFIYLIKDQRTTYPTHKNRQGKLPQAAAGAQPGAIL